MRSLAPCSFLVSDPADSTVVLGIYRRYTSETRIGIFDRELIAGLPPSVKWIAEHGGGGTIILMYMHVKTKVRDDLLVQCLPVSRRHAPLIDVPFIAPSHRRLQYRGRGRRSDRYHYSLSYYFYTLPHFEGGTLSPRWYLEYPHLVGGHARSVPSGSSG